MAVTNTLSMALSPTGVWRRPPALPVRTSVSSAGGNELKTETATRSGQNFTPNKPSQTSVKEVGLLYLT